MTRHDIAELPLYHEARASKAPTAARIFDQFADTARHHITNRDGHTVQVFEPQLTDLHHQILDLLNIPRSAYRSASFLCAHATGVRVRDLPITLDKLLRT